MYEDTLIAAAEHRAQLQADAARRRLIKVATCCKPSTWRRALRRLRPATAGS